MKALQIGLSVASLAAILLAAVNYASAQSPEPLVARDLKLDLSIDYAESKLAGSITYQLENFTDHPVDQISFLLNRLMEASAVHDGSGAALSYSQDVVRFVDTPMRQVDQLRVKLRAPVPPGGRLPIRIDYDGYLVGYTEIGWLYVKDHVDTTFTIIREDALAFPIVGNISDAANRKRPFPAFTYDASIRVPSKYMVALGGDLSRTTNADGTTTWRYKSSKPTFVMNISVAPFDTLVNKGLRVFYFPQDSLGARVLMSKTQTVLDTFAKWFGPLHSDANLTITEIPDGWGSQASLVGGIIQSAAAFRDVSNLREVYHELSHLWNAREADPPSPRWNEGLATFLEELIPEQIDGYKGRRDYEARLLARAKAKMAADSTLQTVPFIDYGKREMTTWSYRVGELMFSALYDLVGESEFKKIIGGYYQRYADGGTTRQFTDFAGQTSSHNLKGFFDDWMYTTRWTKLIANAASLDPIVSGYRASH